MTDFFICIDMTHSETTRLQYLNSMGVTVWQSRFMPAMTTEILAVTPTTTSIETKTAQNFTPDSWEQLRTDVAQCQLCTLCTTRTQTVFGAGNLNAKWLFIGEAPGQNEDEQGIPFVGEAGQLLTEMLRAMQLTRDDIFIANILKCRPPQNRDPHVDEIKQCRDYLRRQMALIQPKIIIAVGRIAAQTLLETNEKIGKLRGAVHAVENTPLIAIYHPSYLLRSLTEKRKAWQDLQFALQTFKSLN
jgi:DNA polymerase